MDNGRRMKEITGMIFDIQRFSVHDGPGIRTTVFLKGCPLRCLWCHNPESQLAARQIAFHHDCCIACGRCREVCPRGICANGQHRGTGEQKNCQACGRCAEECPTGALELQGRVVSAAEVMEEVRRDRPFYLVTHGGVTLSGGEPLLQPLFCAAVLAACKDEGFHTAVETCGHVPWEQIAGVLPYTDLVIFDLKHSEPAQHRRYTGVDNTLILNNLAEIDRRGIPIQPRMPVIPGFNDDAENIARTARIVAGLKHAKPLELIPYHRLGIGKYQSLGREYPLGELKPPTVERMEELRQMVSRWINVK